MRALFGLVEQLQILFIMSPREPRNLLGISQETGHEI